MTSTHDSLLQQILTALNQAVTQIVQNTMPDLSALRQLITTLQEQLTIHGSKPFPLEFYAEATDLMQHITECRTSDNYQQPNELSLYLDQITAALAEAIYSDAVTLSWLEKAQPESNALINSLEMVLANQELSVKTLFQSAIEQAKITTGRMNIFLTAARHTQLAGENIIAMMDEEAEHNNKIISPDLAKEANKITHALYIINAASALAADQAHVALAIVNQLAVNHLPISNK